ncbi:MAG: SRPBCC domain-containing protein [Acidobacteriota bacterium]
MTEVSSKPAKPLADRELVITRVFDAPRELVFKAWTDPESAKRWWGPKGFTLTHSEMDVRPGGRWRACMRSPEGVDFWIQGVYRDITPPERFVYTWAWEKPEGQPGRETLITVEFAEQGNKTEMTFRQAEFETVEDRDSHRGGWTETFDRLAEYLAKA